MRIAYLSFVLHDLSREVGEGSFKLLSNDGLEGAAVLVLRPKQCHRLHLDSHVFRINKMFTLVLLVVHCDAQLAIVVQQLPLAVDTQLRQCSLFRE